LSDAGDITADGVRATPVPVNDTARGLPPASSVTVTAALRGPAAAGVNVIVIVQLALAARVDGDNGHVVVFENSPAFVPVIATLKIVNVPGPLFVTVTVCPAPVVFTVWLPNSSDVGDIVTGGGGPVFTRLVATVKKAPGLRWLL
jgi:hypothetical protein